MVDYILGLGLALPIATSVGLGTVTGVAQGVSQQQKLNEEAAANSTRMLKFHLDVAVDPAHRRRAPSLHGGSVTLRAGKLWVTARRDPATPHPLDDEGGGGGGAAHPFTGFYLAYPDDARPDTRGLVSTIGGELPMLNWVFVERRTLEVRHANRSGSIAHHVGSFDWTEGGGEGSCVTLEGWEGFVAVEEEGGWALYFDREDDGLKGRRGGRRVVEVNLVRRVLGEQEVNQWGVGQSGNIGFKASNEELPCGRCKRMTREKLVKSVCQECIKAEVSGEAPPS